MQTWHGYHNGDHSSYRISYHLLLHLISLVPSCNRIQYYILILMSPCVCAFTLYPVFWDIGYVSLMRSCKFTPVIDVSQPTRNQTITANYPPWLPTEYREANCVWLTHVQAWYPSEHRAAQLCLILRAESRYYQEMNLTMLLSSRLKFTRIHTFGTMKMKTKTNMIQRSQTSMIIAALMTCCQWSQWTCKRRCLSTISWKLKLLFEQQAEWKEETTWMLFTLDCSRATNTPENQRNQTKCWRWLTT